MDWGRARAVLLVAFTVVNLVLAYSLWGPSRGLPVFAEPSARSQIVHLRNRLSDRGLLLHSGVAVPPTPSPMRFLRVEYRADLGNLPDRTELSHGGLPEGAPTDTLERHLDQTTRALIYDPGETGGAVPAIDVENRTQVRQVAEEFLRDHDLLPPDAQLSGIFPREDGVLVVEFVPRYQGLPVYSGYMRVYLSEQGIERVAQHWVQPVGYKEGPSKAVRPAAEALLRLAGHLEQTGEQLRMILDVRLGYYSGPSVTGSVADEISAWETVPVWRITLDNGQVYYVNAFNGELES